MGRSRIKTSGLVGGKEQEHPCVGQVRLWMLLPETEWDVDLYSCYCLRRRQTTSDKAPMV